MKNKERCRNCNLEINYGNWRIGTYRCRRCYGINPKITDEETMDRIIKLLEYMDRRD